MPVLRIHNPVPRTADLNRRLTGVLVEVQVATHSLTAVSRCFRALMLPMLLALWTAQPVEAAPNPEKRVHREAKKIDRQMAKSLRKSGNPGNPFLCHEADALAAIAAVVEAHYGVTEVAPGRVVSDWTYGTSTGTDGDGEWYRQQRIRFTVNVQGTAEIAADVSGEFQQRVFKAGAVAEPAWTNGNADVSDLRSRVMWTLRRLELEYLRNMEVTVDLNGLAQYAAAVAGSDTRVTNDATRVFIDFPDQTFQDSNKKGTKRAAWKRTRQLVLSTLPGTGGSRLSAEAMDKDCFSVNDSAFDCQPAKTQPTGLPIFFVNTLALKMGPHRLPPTQTLNSVATGRVEPTAAPAAPVLRTAAELAAIEEARLAAEEAAARQREAERVAREDAAAAEALQRARETAARTGEGYFRIVVLSAEVRPTRPNGNVWDADASGLAGLAGSVGGVYARLRGSEVAGEASEEVGELAGQAARNKADPDVSGQLVLAGRIFIRLDTVPDSTAPSWAKSVDLPLPWKDEYGRLQDQFTLELVDDDGGWSNSDPIGKGVFSVKDILASGGEATIQAGSASVLIRVEFLGTI